jgi:hypothetical protein
VALNPWTSSVAAVLVTLPPNASLTTTLKTLPESALAVAGVVYEVAVAPLITVPSFCHW